MSVEAIYTTLLVLTGLLMAWFSLYVVYRLFLGQK